MTVYLVGAGPGDPGLLTRRGADLLTRADVVIYDRLVATELLDLAPAEAERINVAKAPGKPSTSQQDINELLIERGRAGQTVVRLKGGDPFVFARGGEECRALADAGVSFEVVPGITSAIAAPAYAGIPVTLRHSSTSLTIVTGHEDPATGTPVDWRAVARLGGTIVVLMGVARIAEITEALIAGGRSPDTPVAAVRWGTRPDQVSQVATLATIAGLDLAAPTTFVIGSVAAESEALEWFTRRPLFGLGLVVTRPVHQSGSLAAALAEQGADVTALPVIEIADPADGGVAVSAAAENVTGYDWVLFTSANTVDRVAPHWRDARSLGRARVACIGPATAATLADHGIAADLVAERYVAEGLLEVFPDPPAGGGRLLLPRAAIARDTLPDGLAARGWKVDVVEAYRTVAVRPSDELIARAAKAEVVTFTAPSTVYAYADVVTEGPRRAACIGPVTGDAARSLGFDVVVEAPVHTAAGLVDALIAWRRTTAPEL